MLPLFILKLLLPSERDATNNSSANRFSTEPISEYYFLLEAVRPANNPFE